MLKVKGQGQNLVKLSVMVLWIFQMTLMKNCHLVRNLLKEMLVEDRTKSEFQYNNLTEKQKDIIDSVSRLNDFAKEMKILQSERNSLLEENKELKAENRNLKEQCRRKEQFISSLIETKAHHEESEMEP